MNSIQTLPVVGRSTVLNVITIDNSNNSIGETHGFYGIRQIFRFIQIRRWRMSNIMARFLAWLVVLPTLFFSRWRRLTILARLYSLLTPQTTITVNGTAFTLFIPDRTSVYWPRHGFASEPKTLTWIDGLAAGDVLYDIGANIGAYAIYAAKRKGVRVVALEPNPFSFHALVRNLELNDLMELVTPLCLALDDKTRPAALVLSGTESGTVGNFLSRHGDTADAPNILNTLAYSLDGLVAGTGLPFPSHLKLDVDGIEPEIFLGATVILADHRLKSVMVEFDTHEKAVQEGIQNMMTAGGLKAAESGEGDGSANRLYIRTP